MYKLGIIKGITAKKLLDIIEMLFNRLIDLNYLLSNINIFRFKKVYVPRRYNKKNFL